MTHEELLAKINEEDNSIALFVGARTSLADALRAVVELHKPIQITDGVYVAWYCEQCGGSCPQCAKLVYCPTIEAIKEQLK